MRINLSSTLGLIKPCHQELLCSKLFKTPSYHKEKKKNEMEGLGVGRKREGGRDREHLGMETINQLIQSSRTPQAAAIFYLNLNTIFCLCSTFFLRTLLTLRQTVKSLKRTVSGG